MPPPPPFRMKKAAFAFSHTQQRVSVVRVACRHLDPTSSAATAASTRCSTCRPTLQRMTSGASSYSAFIDVVVTPTSRAAYKRVAMGVHPYRHATGPARDIATQKFAEMKRVCDSLYYPTTRTSTPLLFNHSQIFPAVQITLRPQVRHPHGPHPAADIRRLRREGR
jgi:hypothetical protein